MMDRKPTGAALFVAWATIVLGAAPFVSLACVFVAVRIFHVQFSSMATVGLMFTQPAAVLLVAGIALLRGKAWCERLYHWMAMLPLILLALAIVPLLLISMIADTVWKSGFYALVGLPCLCAVAWFAFAGPAAVIVRGHFRPAKRRSNGASGIRAPRASSGSRTLADLAEEADAMRG